MLAPLLTLVALASLSAALPSIGSTHVLHEKRAAEPHAAGWMKARRVEARQTIPLRVGLRQRNLDQLEDLLLAVSHPDSPKYGQHWSPAQIVDMFAPAHETIAAVKNWLFDSGLSGDRLRVSPSRGWIAVNVTVEEAESLLHTEYHVYSHPSGAEQFGCQDYSIPAHIQEHIDLIKPTVQFNPHAVAPRLRKRAVNHLNTNIKLKTTGVKGNNDPTLDTCDEIITPDCLRALYNFHYTPRETKKNTFGIVEFTPQAFREADLDLFFTNFSSSQVGSRPIPVLIDGAIVQTSEEDFGVNGESDLDLEAIRDGPDESATGSAASDRGYCAGFDNWLDAVDGSFCTFEGGDDPNQDGIYPDPFPGGFKGPESCGIIPPPHTMSISYAQDEQTITAASANRQCTEYGKLGLMGTSIFYSSGDNGVAGNGGVCLNATLQPDDSGTVFNPSFPSTCPWVTSVGATQILEGNTVNDPETACEEAIFSGGGFSNIFPLPSYQASAVKGFLKNHPPPFTHGEFNNSGNVRAFPDLSANGLNYVIGIDDEFGLVAGTSASAPTTASIFTMINDARLAVGKKPVGFINPAIYSEAFKLVGAFNDITVGGNQGCGSPGFTATTGWDPVTGVGTPNFEKLVLLFLALP
ncbi:subtilisin-like protein [Mycena rosella]|uniref:Subtilisin-like protein n=1 Tax=Mycena rosella TaxID=1033263 RepID=A0AAD7CRR3_MYCRO|nr:subtilisin-like protein [Mycena rosella]